MANAANKTQPSKRRAADLIAAQTDPAVRADCEQLTAMMQAATGEPAAVWGKSMVGFGNYHYVYESGREGDWFLIGFAPRARDLTIYLMAGFEQLTEDLAQLGPHRLGKSCLYVKRLADLDLGVLQRMIGQSVVEMRQRHNVEQA